MKLGDLGRSLGQMLSAIGAKAVEEAARSLRGQLAAELSDLDTRRRRAMADRLRLELACPEHGLTPSMVKRLDGLLTTAILEGRPEIVLGPLDEAMRLLEWNDMRRVTFFQKLMPNAPINIRNVTINGLSLADGTDGAKNK
ncbi:MAG: hypothetical protein IT385_26065 [Deltaproteobacteria bacterium]|nr:hypothetical protein [Deltaproteobacteria bacterium]